MRPYDGHFLMFFEFGIFWRLLSSPGMGCSDLMDGVLDIFRFLATARHGVLNMVKFDDHALLMTQSGGV